MCLAQKDLVCSHLIPAALYLFLRDEHPGHIWMENGVVFPTTRQAQDYLLCADCEDILNKGGESWVIPKLCTLDKNFPLFHAVISQQPILILKRKRDALYFASANPQIDVEKLTHFAMGIFWKASVHSWKGGISEPSIDLGPYSDKIREWLCGKGDFPANVRLGVTVFPPEGDIVTLLPPMQMKRTPRWYTLFCAGVWFQLHVGGAINAPDPKVCFYTNPDHPILVSMGLRDALLERFDREFQNSRKSNAYVRAKAKYGRPGLHMERRF